MAITYRSVKGSALTKEEVDANFETLEDGKVSTTGAETVAGVKTFSSIPVLPASDPTTANQAARKSYVDTTIAASISDTAYDATSWNGVTTIAASKNAIRDKIESMATALTLTEGAGIDITSNVVSLDLSSYSVTTPLDIVTSSGITLTAVTVAINANANISGTVTLAGLTGSRVLELDAGSEIISVAKGTAYNKDYGTGTTNIPEIGVILGNSQIVETNGSGKLITVAKSTGYNLALGTSGGTVLEGSNDALYVKLAGTQTITGAKTFSASATFVDAYIGTSPTTTFKLNVRQAAATSGIAMFEGEMSGSAIVYMANQQTANVSNRIALNFRLKRSGGALLDSNAISSSFSDIGSGTEVSEFRIAGYTAGTSATRFSIVGSVITIATGGTLAVGSSQVLAARKTGWAIASGTATRTTFDTTTVTTAQLAERVKALIDDLHSTAGHGLIGT